MAKAKKQKADSAEQDRVLRRFKHEFLLDYRAESKWRRDAKEDGEFYDGKQWTEEESQKLRDRGQPDVTINRIKPRMDAIHGIQQALRVDTKAFPVFDKENEALAVSEKLRAIENDNDFDQQESLAFEDQTITGRGWYKMGKRWDGLKSRHSVKRAFNEDIVKDRNAREEDLSDCKRLSETLMTELEDAKALFPEAAEKLDMVCDDKLNDFGAELNKQHRPDQYAGTEYKFSQEDYDSFADRERRQIRLVTTYYRSQVPSQFFYHAEVKEPVDVTKMDDKSIETLQATYPGGEIVTQWTKKLNSITFAWNCVLEHKKDIRPHDEEAKFPLVFVPGYTERTTRQNYGLVRQMKDPQREVNKRRSKLIHLMTVNGMIYQDGAFDKPEEARQEFAKPDYWIKKNPGFEVSIEKHLDVSQTHYLMLQTATQEIDNAAASKEVEGRGNSSSSGREFQMRQQQATQTIRKLFSNLRAARRRVALYFLDEILNESPELKEAATKYDIIVDEAPESLNLNSETFEQLISLANNAKVALPMDMIIKVSPLAANVKKEFIDRMKQQQEQQAQAQQQAQQMQQAQIQQTMQIEQMKLQIEMAKAQAMGAKVQQSQPQ